jgi:hypothetical protein
MFCFLYLWKAVEGIKITRYTAKDISIKNGGITNDPI